MKFYENRFRRHLCDMHIDDWNDEFLSQFSPEEYFKNLKRAKVQMPMIYLQSHIGLCNWPSKTAGVHRHFEQHPDDMKRLCDMCRADGMAVVGYYSLNFNTWAHDRHPEWRMLEQNGRSMRENDPTYRYGLCCPNNADYREFVYRQIDEMLDYFTVDGMFYDMLFWQHPCYCPACRERYLAEHGKPLPEIDSCTLDEWIEFGHARARWMGEWAIAVTEYTKGLCPDMPVEHNFSAACNNNPWHCCRDLINEACDYTGGDLYGGPLEQSFTCKFYRRMSRNQPFEYMTGRCTPDLSAHTVTKSEDQLEQQVMFTAAHHGATLLIDAIDPVGTLDERVYDLTGRIFGREMAYEPYLTGEMVEDVGLLYNLDSKINLQTPDGEVQSFLHFDGHSQSNLTNHSATLGALSHLIGAHVPVGITTKNHADDWGKYPVISASNINQLDDATVDKLLSYVAEGGCLYFNNCDQPRLFNELIGGRYVGHTTATRTYIAPTEQGKGLLPDYSVKYPLPFNQPLPMVEGIPDEQVLAHIVLPYTTRSEARCSSIHSDPPGLPTKWPALVEKRYGKGRVIWCAAAPELYQTRGYRTLYLSLLSRLIDRPYTVSATADDRVELVTFADGNRLTLSAVQLSQSEKIHTLPAFTVTVRTDRKVREVLLLPDRQPLPFECADGAVTFTITDLRIMQMVQIGFEE